MGGTLQIGTTRPALPNLLTPAFLDDPAVNQALAGQFRRPEAGKDAMNDGKETAPLAGTLPPV